MRITKQARRNFYNNNESWNTVGENNAVRFQRLKGTNLYRIQFYQTFLDSKCWRTQLVAKRENDEFSAIYTGSNSALDELLKQYPDEIYEEIKEC